MLEILALVAGYLAGSIPFGLLLTRAAGLGDIRNVGSGNIGATNVLRTGRKGLAASTLLLDAAKGIVVAWLFHHYASEDAGLLAAFGAVIGHNFPVWLKFKGGKGVATTLGVLITVCTPVGLAMITTWLLVAAVLRYSSLAALLALLFAPIYALAFHLDWNQFALCLVLGLLGIVRHHANIGRLLRREEPRIGAKKNVEQSADLGHNGGPPLNV